MFSENRYPVAGPYSPTPPCIVSYLLDLGKWRGGGGLEAFCLLGTQPSSPPGLGKGNFASLPSLMLATDWASVDTPLVLCSLPSLSPQLALSGALQVRDV